MEHLSQHIKTGIDLTAIGVVASTFTAWLPPIAAGFTILWTGLRIYETFFGPIYKKRKGKVDNDS